MHPRPKPLAYERLSAQGVYEALNRKLLFILCIIKSWKLDGVITLSGTGIQQPISRLWHLAGVNNICLCVYIYIFCPAEIYNAYLFLFPIPLTWHEIGVSGFQGVLWKQGFLLKVKERCCSPQNR